MILHPGSPIQFCLFLNSPGVSSPPRTDRINRSCNSRINRTLTGISVTRRNPYSRAQLRRALEIAPQQVGRLIDLARLLTRRGRYQEADLSLAKAEQIAPNSPRLMFARADLYIKSKRNLDVARELL